MKCREARSRILPALDLVLPIEIVFALEEHVRGCASCRAEYQEARALDAALARLPEPPVEHVDVERALANIGAAIDRPPPSDEGPVASRMRNTGWKRVAAGAIAASVAAAVVLVALRPRSPAPPSQRLDATVAAQDPSSATGIDLLPEEPVDIPPESPSDSPSDSAGVSLIEPARLARARDEVRCLLAIAAERLPSTDDVSPATDLAASFDRSARDLERSKWPLLRLVEGALGDPDPAVARAALRYLGVRGDRISIRALESICTRPEPISGWGPGWRTEAALALCDAGESGLDSLAAALRDVRARPLVLARLSARGGEGTVRLLEADVREAASGKSLPGASVRLLEGIDALARSGACAVPALLRLGSDGTLSSAEAIDALARTTQAADVSVDFVLARPRGIEDGLLLQVVAALQPPRALPLLERRCLEQRERRADVIDCIAAYGGKDGLAALLRLCASGRIASADLEEPILSCLARDRIAGRAVVEEWSNAKRRVELQVFQRFLIDHSSPAAAPALVALGASDVPPASDRRWAVLLAGETGTAEDADAIGDLFWRLKPSERDLRAACLIAIRGLGGIERAARLVEALPPRTAERLLALLASRDAKDRPASTVSKLSRELEGALAPNAP